MQFQYEIEILSITTSPGHNYFFNTSSEPLNHPLVYHDEIEAVAGKGLPGDRFFNIKPDHRAQVTFYAREVFDDLQREYAVPDIEPEAFRRNVLVRGVDLKALIGHDFRVGDVLFQGTRHCAPCKWMNRVYHPEALTAMRGRGGLQAKVLEGGLLKKGPGRLHCDVEFNPSDAALPIPEANRR